MTSGMWLVLACNSSGTVGTLNDGTGSATSHETLTGTSAGAPTLDGACSLAERYGGFSAAVYQDLGYSYVEGSVTDGVVPIDVREEVIAEGECRLMRRNVPYCHPACGAEETCNQDGYCIDYPVEQDLGSVTVTGLLDAVSMDPISPGYSYFDTGLSHPAFETGAVIELTTGAGAYDPVTLQGVGVELLQLTSSQVELQEGADLPLVWTPPSGAVIGHVRLDLNIDQHGSTPINVWCEFEDDGAGTVSALLIDELMGAGVTGFPSATLTRRTMDRAAVGDGCMDLAVATPRTLEVDVLGYTPCISDADCPEGQSCNEALQVCEDDR